MSQLDSKIGPKIKAFRRQLGIQAKKLAEQRHLFMANYLDRFHKEWDGDA